MIFDTHTHYDDRAFDSDRAEVIGRLKESGVGAAVAVAASAESLKKVTDMAHTYDFVYGALGLHPDEVGDLTPEVKDEIARGLSDPKIVAAGEIGLDYHWDVRPRDEQKACFISQIEMALDAGKPIIVHSRTANQDTMEIISGIYGNGDGRNAKKKGVIHAYPGSAEMAKAYTAMGFFLGIGGVLTYTTSKKLKKVVSEIPCEYLLLETDCPYLSPESQKGERNWSGNLHEVVDAIASIKGMSPEEVEKVTWDNAVRLFLG